MNYFEAFLFGAIQGITEYLPISSSAHLILLPQFLGTQDPGLAFDVFLHLGTLIATLVFFKSEWIELLKTLKTHAMEKKGISWLNLVVVTLPAVMAGGLFKNFIESHLRANWIQAAALATGGVLLWLSDKISSSAKSDKDVTVQSAFAVGCFQVLALIPGMSRSGSTMMGGRFLGFNKAAAAKFSFMASTPITAAALVYEMRHWHELFASTVGVGPMLVAGVSSFVFGWLAIGALLKIVKNFGFSVFAIYRVVLALVVIKTLGY